LKHLRAGMVAHAFNPSGTIEARIHGAPGQLELHKRDPVLKKQKTAPKSHRMKKKNTYKSYFYI
ncbi:hypothetical protein, partial [Salmonella enterica]|uniref:hypothetical protein n=1 Tax=Salmonella enterica TaxID=28901 RepID=UPI003297D6BC